MTTGLRERDELLLTRIRQLIDALTQNYINYNAGFGKQPEYLDKNIGFDIVPGLKYYKLIQRGNGTSVHAFIHKQTGAVYKPASWKAPAKHVRYNLLDDLSFETCLEKADWFGSYLYM